MIFSPFLFPQANEVNTYIIGCAVTDAALLIDAGSDSPEYDDFLNRTGARITGIVLTHFHWDHDQALATLLQRYPVPVYSFTGKTPNGKKVNEGDCVPLGRLATRVFQTTGHTPDSLTLVVENRFAFVGDALFAGSIGGTSNDTLKQEELNHIRRVLFHLPDDCLLCSGHGPLTTVGIEKNHNPFFV